MEQCYKRMNKERYQQQRQKKSAINAIQATDHVSATSTEQELIEVEEISASESTIVYPANELVRINGNCDHKPVVIMLDSGATCNVVRPGLTDKVTKTGMTQVTRFDGSSTQTKEVKKGDVDIEFAGFLFKKVPVMEWTMSSAHDVILGKPWFSKYQPMINWRTHEVSFPFQQPPQEEKQEVAVADFSSKLQQRNYAEVYRIKICSVVEAAKDPIPPEITRLVKEFSDVFPEALPDGLPPSRRVEFDLAMKPDARPSNRPPFRLSKTEQDALDVFVEEKLKKGWIEVSDSPWVSNIFGVPKKDHQSGKQLSRTEWIRSGNANLPIRWVIDYRYVNSQTIIPKIPLPRIDELFDRMMGCSIFSVLDLAQGYHQMRVTPSSRPYTAFRTHQETYQWCVAPMGLAGMPGVWSRLMRVLFSKYPFIVVYLDDICVFSKTLQDHLGHLRVLFGVLRQEKLYCHASKCHLGQPKVHFLGHTVSVSGLEVDTKKTEAIAQWPAPHTQKELQSFLGLAGYYRRFIRDYAKIAMPLSLLVKKNFVWNWGSEQEQSFQDLKSALQNAPVLKLPDFDKTFIVTTDASKSCVGGVLSQVHSGHDHPLAFFSKKLGTHEVNWPTHEKELFAIKLALDKWRHYLHGRPFDIYTDNSACQWLLHHPKVSPKLARFLAFFAQFTFRLHHVKGKLNVVADALSRPPSLASVTFHDCNSACFARTSCLRSPPEFSGESVAAAEDFQIQHASSLDISPAMQKDFERNYKADPILRSIYGNPSKPYVKHQSLLYIIKKDEVVPRLCVPCSDQNYLRTQILEQFHDSDIAAHPGIRRTQLRIAQWYHWDTLNEDVRDYVHSCSTCTRWKHSNARRNGKMIPIPIPKECWEVVSMDFITGLPISDSFDAIMTVVDKLSKRAKYCATNTTDDAQKTAHHFFNSVIRHHGVPAVIISDRDTRFVSKFWKSLSQLMGIKLNMTTAHRAQADGQTERQNLVLEDALRCMVSYHGKDWASKLGTIEYAHSTLTSASTGFTPFELDTGRKERHPFGMLAPPNETPRNQREIAEYAKEFVDHKQALIEQARNQLLQAQAAQKKYYDRKRSQVTFQQGDLVMLDTRHLPKSHATQDLEDKRAKLAARTIGPFEIERMVNENVAKLRLPRSMRSLNPTFNVDLLSHYVETPDKFSTRPIPKTSRIVIDQDTGEELHVVEKLLRKRQFSRQPEWLVKWHGYPDHDATWEREKDIKHVSHWNVLIADFKRRQREVKSGRM